MSRAWRWPAAAALALSSSAAAAGDAPALGVAAPGAQPAVSATPAPAAIPAPTDPIALLIAQARYWKAQGDAARSRAVIDRILALRPDQSDALELLIEVERDAGDRAAATAALARLRRAAPAAPALAWLEAAARQPPIDPAALAAARALARDRRNAEAVARYRSLFGGAPPSAALALEYYETLAGTPEGWEAARAGLGHLADADPADHRAALALASVLTYRDETRAEGLNRLAALARDPDVGAQADANWRQALGWLPQDRASIPAWEAWVAAHPDDKAAATELQTLREAGVADGHADPGGAATADGFAALETARLPAASRQFETALGDASASAKTRASALGGLGIVRLRQGRNAEAASLLAQAVAADPAHQARWDAALAGARRGAAMDAARGAIARGDLSGAERQLRSLASAASGDAGTWTMLAGVQAKAGANAAAEASYRAALRRAPGNVDALTGFAALLRAEGRAAEAERLLAGAAVGSNSPRLQAEALRAQAETLSDPAEQVSVLRHALALQPGDPWTALALARVLVRAGDSSGAQAVMAAVLPPPGAPSVAAADALQASALFALDNGQPAMAAALLDRLPPSARTPATAQLVERARLPAAIDEALQDDPDSARRRLVALAGTAPDPTGARGVAIARALARAGDSAGAAEALAAARAATVPVTEQQSVQYAGVLLSIGRDEDAAATLRRSAGAALSPDDRAARAQIEAGLAIRASDRLAGAGQPADAYDALAPALSRQPGDPALNLAVARIYRAAGDPQEAFRIAAALLGRNPANLEVRRAAVVAALAAGRIGWAEDAVREARRTAPDDPRTWLMAADLEAASGNSRLAVRDLRTAEALRRRQIDQAADAGADAAAVGSAPAGAAANPFRAAVAAGPPHGSAAMPADPLLGDIAAETVRLQAQTAPEVRTDVQIRARSGTSGFDQLTDISTPISGALTPGWGGRLSLTATPVFLTAGTVSNTAAAARLGTGPLLGASLATTAPTAQGAAVDVGYVRNWLAADVGTSPLGFLVQNVVGGVALTPTLAPGLRLDSGFERRAVTDSLLSYAGMRGPVDGRVWGGVVADRGHSQLDVRLGPVDLYVRGGYATLTGANVETNHEAEAGAGVSTAVWRGGQGEVRLGLDLTYFSYAHNLSHFTFGQGGYFSPQTYFAASVPVEYRDRDGAWSWVVGGSIGYQTYREQSSPVFPANAGLQAALLAGVGAANAMFAGGGTTGVVGGVHGELDRDLGGGLQLGTSARYQSTGDWSEAVGSVYLRYVFQDAGR